MSNMSSTNENILYHDRVSQVRARFALSQSDMARRTGISLRAYQNYERGEREIPVALIHGLFIEFGVNPVWLLTGQGSMLQESHPNTCLDQKLLDQIVKAVEDFETMLKIKLPPEHKSRLIGLLYEKSQLISAIAGESATPETMSQILKLVA